jgi:CubicO group peptidase (beta-lactamase class C family)
MLRVITVTLGLTILLLISINSSAENIHGRLETITDDVVSGYMAEKRIQGLSVTIVHQANTVFSKAYGNAHLSPDIPARADSI